MGDVLHVQFSHPCFVCDRPVPIVRACALAQQACTEKRKPLKSDIICVACETRERARNAVTVAWR